MLVRAIACAVLVIALWPLPRGPGSNDALAATSPSQAEQFVRRVGDKAVDLLIHYNVQHEPQFRGNLKALIKENFDLERGTRFVIGHHWSEATPQQRKDLVALLPAYGLEIAARTFFALRARDVREFSIAGTNPSGDADILVLTHIQVGDAQPLEVGWRVHESGGRLRIVDATVAGISVAVTLRDMVNAEIAQKGIDGLIADIRKKLSELSAAKE